MLWRLGGLKWASEDSLTLTNQPNLGHFVELYRLAFIHSASHLLTYSLSVHPFIVTFNWPSVLGAVGNAGVLRVIPCLGEA